MTFKQLTLTVISVLVLIAILPSEDIEATAQAEEYNQMHDVVSSVAHPLLGQFCKRGATLILLGRYEQAKQYEADFGGCMRSLVQRVQMLK